MIKPMIAFSVKSSTGSEPQLDMCSCGKCGWQGRIEDCEWEMDSEGWEYPEYKVWLCPVCEDGVMEDFWFSRRMVRWWNRWKAQNNLKENNNAKTK